MKTITRDELKQMMDQQRPFNLIEVLGPQSFQEFHLPGAINVPVSERFEERIQEKSPDKNRTVVVYCKDTACQASPTAAQTMDKLGYTNVYDYEAGKDDWKAAGLPID